MAESILRLKVESQEYDAKLKRAAEGLNRYADECRKVGGTLEVVEKETLDYVRALGQMDTTSRTATGKLAEMKKTFTELSAQYKQMTDAEKQSPFGKALAASLDQLKVRIQDSKTQLDDINKSINGGGGLTGALDSLSEKFGMSVKSLAGWGTALAAGKEALDVAKDAFFASEETVDEWGRVMDSSKSLYEGFLTALNTGDISGYLSRIDSIVQAARAAYNELDRLGTMKTIQAPQMSAQQTENERMRMMIQTGRYIAPVDGRKASMQNGQLLTPEQITRIEKQLQNGMQKVVTLVGNEVAQTGRAIDAVYNRQAQELGMSLSKFRKGTSSMAEFDKRMQGYQKYLDWDKNARTEFAKQGGQGRVNFDKNNPFIDFKKWGTFRVDGDRYNDLVKLIQQRDQQAGQAYSMQSQAYRTMNRAEGVTLRQLMGGGSGGGGGRSGGGRNGRGNTTPTKTQLTETQKNQQEISRLTTEYQALSDKVKQASDSEVASINNRMEAIRSEIKLLQERNAEIQYQADVAQGKYLATTTAPEPIVKPRTMNPADTVAGVIKQNLSANGDMSNVKALPELTAMEQALATLKEEQELYGSSSSEVWQSYQQQIEDVENRIEQFKGKSVSAAQATTKSWNTAASAINTVSSAIAMIKDPAAKIMATIGQAIANVALAYGETLAKDKTSKSNIYAFIAAAASAMVSMVSTISTIKSSAKYAEGGIIKGNSYSGDNIQANNGAINLNAGELILNRAQQGVIASSLGDNRAVPVMQPYVDGEVIFLGMNNTSKRHGRGEIVTTSMLRKYGLIP